MDSIMSFLMKYIGGFFQWWENLVNWPVSVVGGKTIKWAYVVFAVLIWAAMFTFLPGGWLWSI